MPQDAVLRVRADSARRGSFDRKTNLIYNDDVLIQTRIPASVWEML